MATGTFLIGVLSSIATIGIDRKTNQPTFHKPQPQPKIKKAIDANERHQ